jgi:hypothetical protein
MFSKHHAAEMVKIASDSLQLCVCGARPLQRLLLDWPFTGNTPHSSLWQRSNCFPKTVDSSLRFAEQKLQPGILIFHRIQALRCRANRPSNAKEEADCHDGGQPTSSAPGPSRGIFGEVHDGLRRLT